MNKRAIESAYGAGFIVGITGMLGALMIIIKCFIKWLDNLIELFRDKIFTNNKTTAKQKIFRYKVAKTMLYVGYLCLCAVLGGVLGVLANHIGQTYIIPAILYSC